MDPQAVKTNEQAAVVEKVGGSKVRSTVLHVVVLAIAYTAHYKTHGTHLCMRSKRMT